MPWPWSLRLPPGGWPTVPWARCSGAWSAPCPISRGLAAFGLGPERLILVRAREGREVLWAMEEALGSGRAALVVGEVRRLDWTASRRLQLAAENGATPALLVNGGDHEAAPGALTCWRVGAATPPAFAADVVTLVATATERLAAEQVDFHRPALVGVAGATGSPVPRDRSTWRPSGGARRAPAGGPATTTAWRTRPAPASGSTATASTPRRRASPTRPPRWYLHGFFA